MRRRTVVLVAMAVMATAAFTYAQQFGGGQGRRRGGGRGYGGGYYAPIRRPDANSFNGDFTFCRLAYRPAHDRDRGGLGGRHPRGGPDLSIPPVEVAKTAVH